jgi:hypothetical protein
MRLPGARVATSCKVLNTEAAVRYCTTLSHAKNELLRVFVALGHVYSLGEHYQRAFSQLRPDADVVPLVSRLWLVVIASTTTGSAKVVGRSCLALVVAVVA